MAQPRMVQMVLVLFALLFLVSGIPLNEMTDETQAREFDDVAGPEETPDESFYIHDSDDNSTTKVELDVRASGKNFLALWTESSISTVDLDGGNQYVHNAGFSISNRNNKVIYEKAYPGGYSACLVGAGREFTLSGGCFGQHKFKFRCTTTGVHPSHCQVRKGNGQDLKTNSANLDYGFYGVYATSGGSCGCGFPVPVDFSCPPKQNFKYSNRRIPPAGWHDDTP